MTRPQSYLHNVEDNDRVVADERQGAPEHLERALVLALAEPDGACVVGARCEPPAKLHIPTSRTHERDPRAGLQDVQRLLALCAPSSLEVGALVQVVRQRQHARRLGHGLAPDRDITRREASSVRPVHCEPVRGTVARIQRPAAVHALELAPAPSPPQFVEQVDGDARWIAERVAAAVRGGPGVGGVP